MSRLFVAGDCTPGGHRRADFPRVPNGLLLLLGLLFCQVGLAGQTSYIRRALRWRRAPSLSVGNSSNRCSCGMPQDAHSTCATEAARPPNRAARPLVGTTRWAGRSGELENADTCTAAGLRRGFQQMRARVGQAIREGVAKKGKSSNRPEPKNLTPFRPLSVHSWAVRT
jgi:hypothetical protein